MIFQILALKNLFLHFILKNEKDSFDHVRGILPLSLDLNIKVCASNLKPGFGQFFIICAYLLCINILNDRQFNLGATSFAVEGLALWVQLYGFFPCLLVFNIFSEKPFILKTYYIVTERYVFTNTCIFQLPVFTESLHFPTAE